MVSGNTASAFIYFVSLQGIITGNFSMPLVIISAGALDTQFQTVWMIHYTWPDFPPQFWTYNLYTKSTQYFNILYNIVTIAYNPKTHLFYGLAQAAQSAILYTWDYDYPNSISLVGIVPNVVLSVSALCCVDSKGETMTFVTAISQIVTISLISDAAVISITGPLPFHLYSWSYLPNFSYQDLKTSNLLNSL